MTHAVVTGGSGKLGRAVSRELMEHGYQVLNIDLAPSPAICARSSGSTSRTSAR